MAECVFCRLYKSKEGIIYEDEYFWAQFDKYPVSPGHAEIIPIRHAVSLLDLSEAEWADLKSALSAVMRVIERTDLRKLYESFLRNPLDERSEWFCQKMLNHTGLTRAPDGYNIGVNEGKAAGRTVRHLHIHLIPRYWGDVKDPGGGVRHVIPGMGNYEKIRILSRHK
jgi:histidine triad (HIT) family protein